MSDPISVAGESTHALLQGKEVDGLTGLRFSCAATMAVANERAQSTPRQLLALVWRCLFPTAQGGSQSKRKKKTAEGKQNDYG